LRAWLRSAGAQAKYEGRLLVHGVTLAGAASRVNGFETGVPESGPVWTDLSLGTSPDRPMGAAADRSED